MRIELRSRLSPWATQRLLSAAARPGAPYRHVGRLAFQTPAEHPDQVVGIMMSDAGEKFQFEVLPNPDVYDPAPDMAKVRRQYALLETEFDLLEAFTKKFREELGPGVMDRLDRAFYDVQSTLHSARQHMDLEKMHKGILVARRKLHALRTDLEMMTPHWYPRSPVDIPRIITHKNLDPVYQLADSMTEEQMSKATNDPWHWLNMPVLLEFPLGELFRDSVTTMMITGGQKPEAMELTGDEGFNAQGLEGKSRLVKPLLLALLLLKRMPPHRGRILTQTIRGKR